MGIESELQNNASIALGTSEVSLLELTAAYAPFMNGGYKATPHIVRRISKADGSLLYENNYLEPPKVLNDGVVAAMNAMMRDVIDHGTGKKAQLSGWEAAGKTGTTQSFRDALFVGYTSNLTTGIWFGNDDGQSMKKVTGGGLPAKAWHDFMTAAHQGLAPAPLPGGDYFEPAPAEDPATIGTIISDVLQGGGEERYSGDPVYAEEYPSGPVPAGEVTGSSGPVPPGEVGGEQGTRRTTLLDLILGQ
jgi:penicillin-binding protein 1A